MIARAWSIGWKLAVLGALIWFAGDATHYIAERLEMQKPEPRTMASLIVLSLALYVVLLALPFVPGMEIGVSLLMIFGDWIVPLVYLGTVLALALAFGVGRLIPIPALARLFTFLHLRRAGDLLYALDGKSPDDRLAYIMQARDGAPPAWLPFLLRHRYLALMVALNLPGNLLIGGGGGICMLAGISRLFAPLPFLLSIVVAVAPVPLMMLLTA